MKKELIILVITFLLFLPGCFFNKQSDKKLEESQETIDEDTLKENSETPQLKGKKFNFTIEDLENIESDLSDFQVAACIGADQYGTCNRLPNLDLVTYEECCENLNKCCPDE